MLQSCKYCRHCHCHRYAIIIDMRMSEKKVRHGTCLNWTLSCIMQRLIRSSLSSILQIFLIWQCLYDGPLSICEHVCHRGNSTPPQQLRQTPAPQYSAAARDPEVSVVYRLPPGGLPDVLADSDVPNKQRKQATLPPLARPPARPPHASGRVCHWNVTRL